MKHLFVPYPIALLASSEAAGFDEPCLGDYWTFGNKNKRAIIQHELITAAEDFSTINYDSVHRDPYFECPAPLYQQMIDWFEETHHKYIYAFRYNGRWQWKIDAEHGCDEFSKGDGFNTKYEALNKALEEAFKIIKKLN